MAFKLNLKQRIKGIRFWLAVLLIISAIFGFVYKFTGSQWAYYTALAPWGLLVPFTLIGIVFAFIINPIRRLKEKREAKKKLEDKE